MGRGRPHVRNLLPGGEEGAQPEVTEGNLRTEARRTIPKPSHGRLPPGEPAVRIAQRNNSALAAGFVV